VPIAMSEEQLNASLDAEGAKLVEEGLVEEGAEDVVTDEELLTDEELAGVAGGNCARLPVCLSNPLPAFEE